MRAYAPARIAQGRSGASLPTAASLQFQYDHARARDAVHLRFNTQQFVAEYCAAFPALPKPQVLQSKAANRAQYLQRPDFGRCRPESRWQSLRQSVNADEGFDVAIVVADGLFSTAVQGHALALLSLLISALGAQKRRLAPPWRGLHMGGDIGEALRARLVIVLIGERPGFSSPDSLGVYLTCAHRRGCSDAENNCISNIRAGL